VHQFEAAAASQQSTNLDVHVIMFVEEAEKNTAAGMVRRRARLSQNVFAVEMFAYYSTQDFLSATEVQTHRVCSYQAEEKKMLIYSTQSILNFFQKNQLKNSPRVI
jgi:hypothetical protein